MSKLRLSHSAATKFQQCGVAYDFHYNKKLRSRTTTGALLFGSAVDAAISSVLKGTSKKTPEQIFNYFWNFADINGQKTYLPTATNVVYSDSDADKDLLDETALEKLTEAYGTGWEISLDKIIEDKKVVGFKGLSEDAKKLLNSYNWHCLKRKGMLMIEAFRKKVLPKITEVLGTQVYVKLENENGDSVIGYADLVCKFVDYEKPIVFDVKTSSIEYSKDSVLVSPQLTLYVHSLSSQFDNTRLAGFIVLSKRIRKNKTKKCSVCGKNGTGQRHKTCDANINGVRCNGEWGEKIDPEVNVDIIVDEIPKQTEEIVIQNFDDMNVAIKNGTFTRNFQSCIMPWGKCAFFEKCYHNSDAELVKLK